MSTKEFFAYIAKGAIAIVILLPGSVVASFDRGNILKNSIQGLNSFKGGIFYEIDKWARKK